MKSFIIFLLGLLVTCHVLVTNAQTYQSRYGYQLPPRGTVKVLYIFAEVAQSPGCSVGSSKWPAGQLPSDADSYLDHAVSANPQSYLGNYYKDVTLGEFNLIGDYYNGLIQIPCSSGNAGDDITSVISILNSSWQPDAQGKYRTAHGLSLDDFDDYTYTEGQLKSPGTPDGQIDAFVVLWRNHSVFSCGAGYGVGNKLSVPLKNKSTYLFGAWGHCPNNYGMFVTEFFHSWLGGNNFHTSSGAADWTFWTVTGNFATSGQSGRSSNVACGWDRNFLGIKGGRPYTIGALDPISGNIVNSDINITSHPNELTLVLRDFVTIGDAVRIKLPHINWQALGDVKNQYLWLENHQKVSSIDVNFPEGNGQCSIWNKGIYGYLQIGKDVTQSNDISELYYNEGDPQWPNSLGSYLFPLSAEGNYDFYYEYATQNRVDRSCQWNNASLPYSKYHPNGGIKPNTFIGFSDLYGYVDSEAPNDIINGSDIWQPKFQKYSGIPNGNPPPPTLPAFGDGYDAFTGLGKILNIASNPAPVPVYTLKSNNGSYVRPFENRTIWLNGLSIEVLSTDYYSNGTGAYQVRIKWDDYSVDKDTRWCGYIRLKPDNMDPLARMSKIVLESGKKVTLDRGLSPTQNWKSNFTDGSYSFTEPTVLCVENGTKLTIKDNALLEIINGSTLLVKNGATLEILGTGKITVDTSSHICIEDGAILNVTNNDLGGIITSNTNPVLNHKGDAFPVMVSGQPSQFLSENNSYGKLQCNGPGLVSSGGVYSKGFRARQSVELLPGFLLDASNSSSSSFFATIQLPLQQCSDLFVPTYTPDGTYEVSNPIIGGGDIHYHAPFVYSWLTEKAHNNGDGHNHIHYDPTPEDVDYSENVSEALSISPNPSGGIFAISIKNQNTFIEQVEVFDSQGTLRNKISSFNSSSTIHLNLSEYASGVYLVLLKTNHGTKYSKLIKN